MSAPPNYVHEADAPAYPTGPRRRNALGAIGLLLGMISLALSEKLGDCLVFALLSLGTSIPALSLARRPRGLAVAGIALAALAAFVAIAHAVNN